MDWNLYWFLGHRDANCLWWVLKASPWTEELARQMRYGSAPHVWSEEVIKGGSGGHNQ